MQEADKQCVGVKGQTHSAELMFNSSVLEGGSNLWLLFHCALCVCVCLMTDSRTSHV